MKRIFVLGLHLLCLVGVLGWVSSASSNVREPLANNLLRNGDFEDQLRYWDTEPSTQWEPAEGLGDSGALIMHAPFIKYERYIYEVKASQCVQLENADIFYIEANLRFDYPPKKATAHRVEYIWFEDNACSYGGQYGGFLQPELVAGWQLLDKANLKPAMNAKSLSIVFTQHQSFSDRELIWFESIIKWAKEWLDMEYQPPTAAAYWDNVLVTPTHYREQPPAETATNMALRYAVGENILVNPTFDKNGDGWRVSSRAQWIGDAGVDVGGAIRSAVESEGSGLGVGVFDQCVLLDGHDHYRMGVRYKQDENSTQSGGGRLRLTWYSEERCRGNYKTDTHHADIGQDSGWQELVVDSLVRPEDARSAKVTMIQSVQGQGEYAGYWDNAYFMPVEVGR